MVVAEPFSQWVIEDDFAADRPAWERAGAVLTRDAAAWEAVKLRMLNASHSLLAYLVALPGYDTIAASLTDDRLAAAAESLMVEDVAPTVRVPDGLDLGAYRRQVLTRFANPALHDRTVQVAMDGSQKLPMRLLGTVRDRLAAGAVPRHATLAVAAWMAYVAQASGDSSKALMAVSWPSLRASSRTPAVDFSAVCRSVDRRPVHHFAHGQPVDCCMIQMVSGSAVTTSATSQPARRYTSTLAGLLVSRIAGTPSAVARRNPALMTAWPQRRPAWSGWVPKTPRYQNGVVGSAACTASS